MRRIITTLLIAGSLVGPAIGASARQADDKGLGIRLVDAPSALRDDPRAQVYIVDHLRPGTTITRTIEVANDLPDPNHIELYATAATLGNGEFSVAPGRASNELTAWVTVDPPSLDLAPRARGRAEIMIAVPDSAEGGERYAAVLAELRPRPSGEPGVAVTSRVGIRIYGSVGDQEPPTSFELQTFTPVRDDAGRPGVDIRACNDGGRAVDLEGELTLAEGPGDTSAGPFSSSGATTLAPGDCGDLAIRAPADLPRGPWKARATLRSGKAEEAAEASITFPDTVGTKSAPVDAERVTESPGGRLAILLAILLLLLALLLLFFLWRRRKKREDEEARARADGPLGSTFGSERDPV